MEEDCFPCSTKKTTTADQANFTLQSLKHNSKLCSGDETDLKKFLEEATSVVSNDEKEYLTRFVLSGISDNVRGRVPYLLMHFSSGWYVLALLATKPHIMITITNNCVRASWNTPILTSNKLNLYLFS